MQPRLLATFDADDGDIILVGPICTIAHCRAVQLMFARPSGALIALNIIPAGLDIRSATARE